MKKGLLDFSPQLTDIAAQSVWTPQTTAASGGVRGLPWGMLGNDEWGDCYWASALHEFMAIRHRVGASPEFTTQDAVGAYAAYLGLASPADLSEKTDLGTDARLGAKFRRQTGVSDAADHTHYIGAFAFEADPHQLPGLIDTLGAVTVCVELTEECEQAFGEAEQQNKDFVWNGKGTVAGGHAIAGTYWTPEGVGVVSWGREGIITYDYLEQYMQTAVVYFTRGALDPEGETPAGVNKEKLIELVKDVRTG